MHIIRGATAEYMQIGKFTFCILILFRESRIPPPTPELSINAWSCFVCFLIKKTAFSSPGFVDHAEKKGTPFWIPGSREGKFEG